MKEYYGLSDNYAKRGNLMELMYHLAVVANHTKSDFVALIKALVKNPRTLKVLIKEERKNNFIKY